MIAHNAKFDLKFLNYYLEALNLEPITNYICTLEMLKQVKSYNGKNKKLETACSYYNIENKNAHRADSDTLATAKLFLTIKDKIYIKPIEEEEVLKNLPNLEIGDKVKLLDYDDYGIVYKTIDKYNNVEVLYREEFIKVNIKE